MLLGKYVIFSIENPELYTPFARKLRANFGEIFISTT